jgi:hypothetical protein
VSATIMRLDPAAPPFWERERGDGPITRIMAANRRIEARRKLYEIEQDIRVLRPNQFERSVRERLDHLLAERDRLRAELGLPYLVGRVA